MNTLPAFLAVCHVVDHLDVDKNAVGERRAQGHQPDGANSDPAGGHFHARPERVQDDEEAIDGDGCQSQRRNVHRRPLSPRQSPQDQTLLLFHVFCISSRHSPVNRLPNGKGFCRKSTL